ITVLPAEPPGPTASFIASPTSGNSPLTVSFDASGSSYEGGTISSYEWNFGDGRIGYSRTMSHTYFSVGNFTATLTVRASDGKTGTASVQITVTTPGGGTPAAGSPSARFTIVRDAILGAAGNTGVAPFNALFDPKDTKAAVGKTLAQLVWSFGDSGAASTPNVVTQWHTYVTDDPSEVFSVMLLVLDNENDSDQITKTVKVYNHQPVAGFEISNPAGGYTIANDDEEYANVAAARAAPGRWDDDDADDGVIMGDLQNLAGPTVNVFIRSRRTTDADWFILADTGAQDTLTMAEGILAAPGTTPGVPDDYVGAVAAADAFSYDPEGQYWPLGAPAWFPNQAWGIQWIYVDWDDGPEEQFDYVVECNDPVAPLVLYDQDAVMGHTYAYPGGSMTKTITIRVVDFLGGESTFSRTVYFMLGTEGVDDL
ncbi:PKD domain-containing protein, partial [Candidatus Bipolaricaulota bacterium]|nr:PKD domain-containing protein [Candidatus Bipolaricaulota bacterium]